MRILIAEDDPVTRRLLEGLLVRWGHEVVATEDGQQALQELQKESSPLMAILDWNMPFKNGVEVASQLRENSGSPLPYIILLTAQEGENNIVTGLDAGADDYITKPFLQDELRARVQVGTRVVQLHAAIEDRVRELEQAMANIKQLQGLIPICSSCKMIRDDQGYWNQLEVYLGEHSAAELSHSLCPNCLKSLYPEFSDKILKTTENTGA